MELLPRLRRTNILTSSQRMCHATSLIYKLNCVTLQNTSFSELLKGSCEYVFDSSRFQEKKRHKYMFFILVYVSSILKLFLLSFLRATWHIAYLYRSISNSIKCASFHAEIRLCACKSQKLKSFFFYQTMM